MSAVREAWRLACPNCGSDESLQVQITVMADLSDEGTDPCGDHQWDDESFMRCRACSHAGIVKSFRVGEETP